MKLVRELPLWSPVGAVALSLTWLLPNATPPWVAFHKDAYLAVVMLVLAIIVAFRSGRSSPAAEFPFRLDLPALLLLALAALTVCQVLWGVVHFTGHGFLGAIYLVGAATAVIVAAGWERLDTGAPARLLMGAFLLAGLATAAMMWAQWMRLDVDFVWLNEVPSQRPAGNLMQPNNASTLLILSLVALAWFSRVKGLYGWLALMISLPVVGAVVIAGSRIGYISFVSLIIFALLLTFVRSDWHRWRLSLFFVLTWFCVFAALLNGLGEHVVTVSDMRPQVTERQLASVRLAVYEAYIHAVISGPWYGHGFAQGAKAQMAAAELGYELPGYFPWAHNTLLDVAIWFGPWVGVLVTLCFLMIGRTILPHTFKDDNVFYVSALTVLLVHGMVELPLAYAYFLLPASMLIGVQVARAHPPTIVIRKSWLMGWLVVLGFSLAILIYDYLKAEVSIYEWRFRQAKIGTQHSVSIPDTLLLNQFRGLMQGLSEPEPTLRGEQLFAFREGVHLFPSPVALVHLARAQVNAGEFEEARRTVKMARAISGMPQRKAMSERWQQLSASSPKYGTVNWEP